MEDRSRSTKVQTFSIVELQGDFFLLSVSSQKLNLATPSSAVSVDGPFSYIIQFVIFEVSTDSSNMDFITSTSEKMNLS